MEMMYKEMGMMFIWAAFGYRATVSDFDADANVDANAVTD